MKKSEQSPILDVMQRFPIHRGIFLFGPDYLSTIEAWRVHFVNLIEEIFNRHLSINDRISFDGEVEESSIDDEIVKKIAFGNNDSRHLVVTLHSYEFWVDGDLGHFALNKPSVFPSLIANGEPSDFLRQLRSIYGEMDEDEYFDGIGDILLLPQLLLYEMRKRFKTAIKSGHALVGGRIGSPIAEFSYFELDQIEHFRLSRINRNFYDAKEVEDLISTAVLPSGERIYSVFVSPAMDQNSLHASGLVNPEKVLIKQKPGRKGYDWNDIENAMLNHMKDMGGFDLADLKWNGPPRLAEWASQYCIKKFGISPGRTQLKIYVAKVCSKYEAIQDEMRVAREAEN